MNVSIIIPVYNVEEYIVKCLTSVSEQTFQGAMECLIIDDCGQDDSIRLAEEFVQEYQGYIDFRIIHHKQNKGLSGARNAGIREARGEWLCFLDSDDWIIPECIELMMKQVEKHPDVEIVFAGAKATEGYGFMDYTKKDLPEFSDDRDWIQKGMLDRFQFSMTAWNRLISAEFVRNNNLYFEEGFIHEDEIWNLAISQVITTAAFVNKNTYCYNVRANSIMTYAKYEGMIMWDRIKLWNKMLDIVKGYHTERQIEMIFDYARFGVEKFDSFKQYVSWQMLAFKTINITPLDYRNIMKQKVLAKSTYIIKYYLYKWIHGNKTNA